MKKRKKEIVMIFLIIISIGIKNISVSKNDYESISIYNTQIAKAIIDVEREDTIEQKITRENFPMEYYFFINNFIDDKINEIDFDYIIEIELSSQDFPVEYDLIDCESNLPIELENGKSKILKLDKFKKKSRKFKVRLSWKELDRELSDNLDIKLKIHAVQSKE